MQLMGFSFVRERKATKLIPVKCTDSHHLYTAQCQENEATFGDMTLVYNLCFGFDKWSYVGKVSQISWKARVNLLHDIKKKFTK